MIARLTLATSSSPVALRGLRVRDAYFAYRLAADAEVRRQSFDGRRPTLRSHLRWLWAHLVGPDYAYLVTHRETGKRIGVTTLHPRDGKLWIGVSFRPEWRDKGLGTAAIRSTVLLGALPDLPVYAAIKATNPASLQAFKNAGFLRPVLHDDHEPYWVLAYAGERW